MVDSVIEDDASSNDIDDRLPFSHLPSCAEDMFSSAGSESASGSDQDAFSDDDDSTKIAMSY